MARGNMNRLPQKLPKTVLLRTGAHDTKTGAHNFFARVKNLCASKSARPVLVILIHPKVDYAGKNVLLTSYRFGRGCYPDSQMLILADARSVNWPLMR